MAVIGLTKDNFESTIDGNDLVVVAFCVPGAGPCREFAPVFDATSDRHASVVFATVDAEREKEFAGYFEIRAVPAVMVFRQGVILYSEAAWLPGNALNTLVEQVSSLDMVQVRKNIADQGIRQS